MSTITAQIQLRRDTVANWTSNNPILLAGEMALSTDLLYTGTDQPRYKIGNGIDTWLNLDYVPEGGAGSFVPYTGATQDVDLGANGLNAKFLSVKGNSGAGHLGLKHQSVNATAGGQETVLFAGNDGELYYKNDGSSVVQVASRTWVTSQNYLSTEKSAIQSFFFNTNINPVDSVTAYFGVGDAVSSQTKDSAAIIPISGTIKSATISSVVFTTLGSAENSTFAIRVYSGGFNGTLTDYTLTTTYKFNSTYNQELITGLSIAVSAGDAVEIKWITPNWATNPLGVRLKSNIFIS